MPARVHIDADDLVQRYLAGTSQAQLARDFGVSRQVIIRRLHEQGIEARGRADANRLMAAGRTPEENAANVAAAHAAVRGSTRSEAEMAKRAGLRVEYRVSPFEGVLAGWLEARGIESIDRQTPIGRYNADLSIGPVAVELHRASAYPLSPAKYADRTNYLLDRGWHVLYVWSTADCPLSEDCADEVVSWAHEANRLPAGFRQYGVIRGCGEVVFTETHRHEGSVVFPPSPSKRHRHRTD